MRQRQMFNLLDQGYKTIRVVFSDGPYSPQAPAQSRSGAPMPPPAPRAAWDDTGDSPVGYIYKAPIDTKLTAGESYVVVNSPHGGLKVAQVVQVHARPEIDFDGDTDYKWIVQAIDLSEYNANVERERNFNDAMVEVERERQRENVMESFRNKLPEGSHARQMFDQQVQAVAGLQQPAPLSPPAAPPAS